ncbi:MAG: hypothetical protein U0694_23135 [Anaerolineae bacterium]
MNGTIDGGTGYDADVQPHQRQPRRTPFLAEQIAAANWRHAHLQWSHLHLGQLRGTDAPVFSIARINLPADPLAVFCSLQGGIDTYAIVGQQGTLSLGISAQQLSNGLTQAQSSGDTVLVGQSATSTVCAGNGRSPGEHARRFHLPLPL